MSFTIGKKITGAFLLVITLVAIMSVFTYYEVGQLNGSYQQLNRANMQKVELAQGIAVDVANEAVAMRRFNFTGDHADIPIFNDYRKQADEKIKMLESTIQSEATKKLLQTVKKEKASYESIAERSFEAKKINNAEQVAVYMGQAGAPFKATMVAAQEIVRQINEFVKTEEAANNASASQMQMILLIVNILVAVISLAISFFISRSISRPTRELAQAAAAIADGDLSINDVEVKSADEIGQLASSFNRMKANLRAVIRTVSSSSELVAASSEELTASAEQSAQASNQVAGSICSVAEGSSRQLEAVESASAIIGKMSADLQQAAAGANAVASKSIKAAEKATEGGKSVATAVAQMTSIQASVNSSAQVVAKLGDRSKEIGQIVNTISGIAGQTNLLALNAAIEAARAGEQGRGFAVVAEEVRKLAEQSQEAAKRIAELIGAIQIDTDQAVVAMATGTNDVKVGADVVNTAGLAFREIESLVIDVTEQIKGITVTMQQMAGGSQQIVSSMKEIDRLSKTAVEEAETVSAATEEQSASMQEIASSSQGLANMAQELQEAVSRFRI